IFSPWDRNHTLRSIAPATVAIAAHRRWIRGDWMPSVYSRNPVIHDASWRSGIMKGAILVAAATARLRQGNEGLRVRRCGRVGSLHLWSASGSDLSSDQFQPTLASPGIMNWRPPFR